MRTIKDPYDNMWRYIDVTEGCWMWTGAINSVGYGVYRTGNKMVLAHRFIYSNTVSPIPDGLTIDHLCANRHCVNINHMEPVTLRINIQRGVERRKAKKRAAL